MNKPEKKQRIPLWIYPSTIKAIAELQEPDNCKSPSEFIEKAILFYCGYLNTNKSSNYLAEVITSTVKGIVDESTYKISRNMFKLAVEQGMMMHFLGSLNQYDEEYLRRIRAQAVSDVKKTNGALKLEEAIRFQQGDV